MESVVNIWSEMYRSGYSTHDIARKYRCSPATVRRTLKKTGVELRSKGERGTAGQNQALCWSCVHGYADDCFGMPFEMRAWVRKAKTEQKLWDNKPVEIRLVQQCDRYEAGRKPLAPEKLLRVRAKTAKGKRW